LGRRISQINSIKRTRAPATLKPAGRIKNMNRSEMIAKLNRTDINGVGVIEHNANGRNYYHFYEDMSDSKGIERASQHFSALIDAGKVKLVEYIHRSPNCLYFVDWRAEKDTFCMNDFYIRYNKAHNFSYYYDFQRLVTEWTPQLKVVYDYNAAIDDISEVTWKAI
jgi:hypothetical protein